MIWPDPHMFMTFLNCVWPFALMIALMICLIPTIVWVAFYRQAHLLIKHTERPLYFLVKSSCPKVTFDSAIPLDGVEFWVSIEQLTDKGYITTVLVSPRSSSKRIKRVACKLEERYKKERRNIQ